MCSISSDSAHPFRRLDSTQAYSGTDQDNHLRSPQIWSRPLRCSYRSLNQPRRESRRLHEPQSQDLSGMCFLFVFNFWAFMRVVQADVFDHMEYILTSLDMFAGISENLIDYTFNVRSSLLWRCHETHRYSISRWHHTRWMKLCAYPRCIVVLHCHLQSATTQATADTGDYYFLTTDTSYWVLRACQTLAFRCFHHWARLHNREWTSTTCGPFITTILMSCALNFLSFFIYNILAYWRVSMIASGSSLYLLWLS